MWFRLTTIALFTSMLALPQASTTSVPSPVPTIPWLEKYDAFRTFLLSQSEQPALKAMYGPFLRQTFADGQCLEVRFWNWNCFHDIPYKTVGVVKWFDSLGLRSGSNGVWDAWRFYQLGYYRDPEDGFGFYDNARLVFGSCGNRGPQSSCGTSFCTDEEGKEVQRDVPEGQTPYQDPNDRDRLCLWLRGNGTSSEVL
jgi:hypothetical protein